jgi:DNA-binding transcriptional LysR family regulator
MTEALSLALAGVGIAYVIESLARRYLRDGSLEWLLPQTAVEHDGAFLYYPRRASLAPKLYRRGKENPEIAGENLARSGC